MSVAVVERFDRDNKYVRRWLWRWWRCGGVVGIGVGGGSRRSGEEEAGGLGRRQHHPLVAARLVTGGVCVYVFVFVLFIGADC